MRGARILHRTPQRGVLGPDRQTLTGLRSESHCGAKHMDGSDAAAKCVKSCVRGGAKLSFVTEDKKVIPIANPSAVKEAQYGRKVKVTGEMSGDSLTVNTIDLAD